MSPTVQILLGYGQVKAKAVPGRSSPTLNRRSSPTEGKDQVKMTLDLVITHYDYLKHRKVKLMNLTSKDGRSVQAFAGPSLLIAFFPTPND